MKSTKLYKTNSIALELTVQCFDSHSITGFTTQNRLYRFIEDIKNPGLRNNRDLYRTGGSPYYMGEKNYGPIINKLFELNILSKTSNGYRINFKVNHDAIQTYLQTKTNS